MSEKKRRARLPGWIFLVGLLFFFFVACQVFFIPGFIFKGPSDIEEIKNEFPIEGLLAALNSSLPKGWSYPYFSVFTSSELNDPGLVSFYSASQKSEDVFIVQDIYIFGSPSSASRRFQSVWAFHYAGELLTPGDWEYVPEHTQDFDYRCSSSDNVASLTSCDFLLRYSEVVIYLGTPISDPLPTNEVEKILAAIDSFMSDY